MVHHSVRRQAAKDAEWYRMYLCRLGLDKIQGSEWMDEAVAAYNAGDPLPLPLSDKRERSLRPKYKPRGKLELMKFPTEILERILEFTLCLDKVVPVSAQFRRDYGQFAGYTKNFSPTRERGITWACRSFLEPCQRLYYQVNTFSLDLHDFDDMDAMQAWQTDEARSGPPLTLCENIHVRAGYFSWQRDFTYLVICLRPFKCLRTITVDLRCEDRVDFDGGLTFRDAFASIPAPHELREAFTAAGLDLQGCELTVIDRTKDAAESSTVTLVECIMEGMEFERLRRLGQGPWASPQE